MVAAPSSCSCLTTVDLPEAIPPVSPIERMLESRPHSVASSNHL